MIVFPNCKINLGLHILNKREDGYHNLETVFYPVQLRDALEVVKRDDGRQTTDDTHNSPLTTHISFSSTGLTIAGDEANNLCIKAYQLLKKDFPSLPPVQMHLHKAIPMGAGLGGGSADGAFALKLLNDKFQLGLSTQQLIDYALQLGSDCPFFIVNKPCYATGRGEKLEAVELDLSAYHFAVVNPGIHVNTGWAFAQLNINGSARPDLKAIIQQPIETWKEQLINDFEEAVSKAHPEIATIKQQLYDAGAVYASMTGSGSTVFGIFKEMPQLKFPESYLYKLI
ncbi:4-(cytidine 5'-diphospho)-2-C-methyl-D-erythritol kinase [Lacibacter sp.]|uniref:4-(cytidine 5'-diphospho)-2-C-methyl-D-erythritol kinase n=1 Tax=Lacibacter sp. TaxID=1915409 RepID=UPI002B4AB63B|nr:4-(cytidine 5'-diphospho)-2-C-methyl-D-erythritol kinase [Lacibacter sp.]HLP37791.1 4-(cytidine 5'-diphospho)-2-C-methyl-D-erythritol kinase [Lacibacter sp.]